MNMVFSPTEQERVDKVTQKRFQVQMTCVECGEKAPTEVIESMGRHFLPSNGTSFEVEPIACECGNMQYNVDVSFTGSLRFLQGEKNDWFDKEYQANLSTMIIDCRCATCDVNADYRIFAEIKSLFPSYGGEE
jgi:hypothetical protein